MQAVCHLSPLLPPSSLSPAVRLCRVLPAPCPHWDTTSWPQPPQHLHHQHIHTVCVVAPTRRIQQATLCTRVHVCKAGSALCPAPPTRSQSPIVKAQGNASAPSSFCLWAVPLEWYRNARGVDSLQIVPAQHNRVWQCASPAAFASSAASTKSSRNDTPSGRLGVPVTDTTSTCAGNTEVSTKPGPLGCASKCSYKQDGTE